VPDLLTEAGFTDATAVSRGNTRLGGLTFYRATA
jgi:hypothetical protein